MACSILKGESHVDYLTLTHPASAADSSCKAFARISQACLLASCSVDELRPSRILGYVGQRSSAVFAGASGQGQILQASGALAASHVLQDWPASSKCTRLDLAVTVWYSEYLPWIAQVTNNEATESRDKGLDGAARTIVLYMGNGKGDTCYVGSRQSERYLRVYDKDKESGIAHYQNAWRWELECKGRAAIAAFRDCRANEGSPAWVAAIVEAYVRERQIDIGPCIGNSGAILVGERREPSTDGRKLDWLVKNVSPLVKRLIGSVGEEVVYLALGLRRSP